MEGEFHIVPFPSADWRISTYPGGTHKPLTGPLWCLAGHSEGVDDSTRGLLYGPREVRSKRRVEASAT